MNRNLNQRKIIRCDKLYRLYTNNKGCDLQVICSSEGVQHVVDCHRVALAVGSDYFNQLLMRENRNEETNHITVHDVDIGTLREVMTFVYQGQCQIIEHNVLKLLDAGRKWKMDDLIEDCYEFMKSHINTDNVVCYNARARQDVTAVELVVETSQYIKQHFLKLTESDKLLEMSLENLQNFIASDRINVSDETTIYDAVMKWKRSNPTQPIDTLLKLIRYEYIEQRHLVDMLLHPLIRDKPDIVDLVKQGLSCYHHHGNSLRRQDRRYWGDRTLNTHHRLYKVTKDHQLCKYDEKHDRWDVLKSVPDWIDGSSVSLVYASKVFIFSSSEADTCLKCYVTDVHNSLFTCDIPDLPEPINLFSMVYTGQEIYITGGDIYTPESTEDKKWIPTNKVYRIDLTANKPYWTQATPMRYAVYQHQSWYHRGHVYVVGGYDCNKRKSKKALKYNTSTSIWEELAEWSVNVDGFNRKGLFIDNKVNFFKENQHIVYNPDTDNVSVERYASGKLKYIATPVLYDGKVVVMTKEHVRRDDPYRMKRYDHVTKRWSDVKADVSNCCGKQLLFSL